MVGYALVEEPGRRIVQEELAGSGAALPWFDGAAFARRAMAMALRDHTSAQRLSGWVFFDRGLIDAAAALQHATGEAALASVGQLHRYHRRVFFAPPWPEIYATDPERRHELDSAFAEQDWLFTVYHSLGYEVIILPKVGVSERADFILRRCRNSPDRFKALQWGEKPAPPLLATVQTFPGAPRPKVSLQWPYSSSGGSGTRTFVAAS